MMNRTRATLLILAVAAALAAEVPALQAQTAAAPEPAWELRFSNGRFVPTGTLSGAVRSADLTAATVARRVSPAAALVATFGWSRSRELGADARPRLDVLTFDIGGEFTTPVRRIGAARSLRGFAGTGLGLRSYQGARFVLDRDPHPAIYAAIGGELGIRRLRARIELRDHLAGATPNDAIAGARNDVSLMVGLRLVKP